jgi:putative transposase
MAISEAVAARWKRSHPAVARLIEEGVEDCLACLAYPLAHRTRIRTTNGLERLNEEIKRRTRVVPGALWADSRMRRPVCGW